MTDSKVLFVTRIWVRSINNKHVLKDYFDIADEAFRFNLIYHYN